MEVTVGDDSFLYGPGGNLSVKQFYAMQRGGKFATTSQINPVTYRKAFESALKSGYDVLYCAIFLGEVFDFYYVIPHWDIILHACSGAMLSALGFILVDLLNRNLQVSVDLSPFFESVFAFCFALALGALWEIYEFAGDIILDLNMQKAYTADGMALAGTAALLDTMEDIIVDAIAAAVVALAGYKANKREARYSCSQMDDHSKDTDVASYANEQ